MKNGIILAAGLGTRLSKANLNIDAKPLIPIEELTLLLRAIRSQELANTEQIIIVLGWQAEEVKKHVIDNYKGPAQIQFAYNQNFKFQNGISVLSAWPFIKDNFLLTMADHILDDAIMDKVKDHQPTDGGATLCVDYKLESIFDMDDATKVRTEGKTIRDIGKQIEIFNCVDTGVFVCSQGLLKAIDAVYRQKGDASLSEGVKILAQMGKMDALDIGNCYWQDVDTPEMLAHAEKIIAQRKEA